MITQSTVLGEYRARQPELFSKGFPVGVGGSVRLPPGRRCRLGYLSGSGRRASAESGGSASEDPP